jgi:amidase
VTTDDICDSTAAELARLIRHRELSCAQVLEAHLIRIERDNPKVNAMVTLVPDQARAAAGAADAALARGDAEGVLFGLPVAHKDLAETRGIRTTFGSPIFRDFVPDRDAIIVERLKAAGAITVGKTNTPEFGAGSQTYNEVFGATRNPYDLRLTSGGSSGGAAVALACGMVPIADGSDLGGSLRNPASFCNVVGFRPSIGRVPNWPALDAWNSFSVVGPMARTVEDVALMMSAIAGPDPRAPLSIAEPASIFAQPLARDFKGTRIAWVPDLGGSFPVERTVIDVLDKQRATLESLGCVVESVSPDFRGAEEVFQTSRALGFALVHGSLLKTHRHLLKDTVVWNIEQGLKLTAEDVVRALRLRTELHHRLREFMQRYAFLALPVSQVPPFDVEQRWVREIDGARMQTYIEWMKSCYFISVTGLPAISIPAGFTDSGLPVGVQLVGAHQADFLLLQLAHAFERATLFGRRKPAAD